MSRNIFISGVLSIFLVIAVSNLVLVAYIVIKRIQDLCIFTFYSTFMFFFLINFLRYPEIRTHLVICILTSSDRFFELNISVPKYSKFTTCSTDL